MLRWISRETQDFASLQAGAGGDDEVMGHCINMRKRLSDDEELFTASPRECPCNPQTEIWMRIREFCVVCVSV